MSPRTWYHILKKQFLLVPLRTGEWRRDMEPFLPSSFKKLPERNQHNWHIDAIIMEVSVSLIVINDICSRTPLHAHISDIKELFNYFHWFFNRPQNTWKLQNVTLIYHEFQELKKLTWIPSHFLHTAHLNTAQTIHSCSGVVSLRQWPNIIWGGFMHYPIGSAVNVLLPVCTESIFKGATVLVEEAYRGNFIRQVKAVIGVITDHVLVNAGPRLACVLAHLITCHTFGKKSFLEFWSLHGHIYYEKTCKYVSV